MNEALRQFALGVAGVRVWYARAPLPGAAPSPDFDFCEPGQEESQANNPEPMPDAPASASSPPGVSRRGLAQLQGLLAGEQKGGAAYRSPARQEQGADGSADAVLPVAAEVADAPAGKDAADAGAPETTPVNDVLAGMPVKLHWRFWCGSRWLLISSTPDEASRGLEDRLAENVLRALGDSVLRTETLRWPVFNNPEVPGNDAAGAAEVLASMVQGFATTRQLWLGIEPEDLSPEATRLLRLLVAPLGDAAVSFPRSLTALSSEPDSKRQLWQALRQAEAL
ncbi:hypothetical protein [Marinobacter sp. AN1]|uniref:hypothetical protein n=1 Tax=Marinobacter sp. AN1 TaxID=2886046 RepID=UPI00223276B9|nr:hypothetical protein [Marinobacter sp. AN1]UZD66807.1 hypothetical protein LJ360_05580 [Marinobacter sp. AN1]